MIHTKKNTNYFRYKWTSIALYVENNLRVNKNIFKRAVAVVWGDCRSNGRQAH